MQQFRKYVTSGALATGVLILVTSATLAQPLLMVRIPSLSANSGEQGVNIPVYLSNFQDVVAGFELWLQMDRTGIARFQTAVQTEGTLVANWEYLESRHLSGQPYEIKIAGIADLNTAPVTPGISPQQDQLPLCILKVDCFELPDSVGNQAVEIIIQDQMLSQYNFSDPYGNSIGVVSQTVIDTTYLRCLQWAGATCLSWGQVPSPPYDSIIVNEVTSPRLDSSRVFNYDGSLTVFGGYDCGDINGDRVGPDISDLVSLVEFMFQGGEAPKSMISADVNGSGGQVDISDLVHLVSYMFQGGDPLACP